jgi:ketosteroid isomerase-like protein
VQTSRRNKAGKRGGDSLVVHRSQDSRVVILEHGTILSTAVPYDNRLISVVTIEKRKIVHWRDYMDSLTRWIANVLRRRLRRQIGPGLAKPNSD